MSSHYFFAQEILGAHSLHPPFLRVFLGEVDVLCFFFGGMVCDRWMTVGRQSNFTLVFHTGSYVRGVDPERLAQAKEESRHKARWNHKAN